MKKEESLTMKRREFLKAGALVGAAAATVGIDGYSNVFGETADQKEKVFILPNVSTPSRPVIRDPEVCIGCNTCVDVCQVDVYVPNPVKGKPPITLHPDECWYCGCCVNECPLLDKGAIKFNWPLQQKGYFKRKDTGEIIRF
jgi:NAD-dependent dihydropyrimidine dehydrogenase PreA subunit